MENTQVGPFLVLKRLGNRRQKVYRARQTEQQVDVALKFLGMPDESVRRRAIQKIQVEVERLKQLEHPNLVRILGAGMDQDQIFLATELIKGESLTSLLSRRGNFAPDQVIEYGRQVADLLDYLHQQEIIHAKLTPDKILIDSDGDAKVADLRLNRSRKRTFSANRKREVDVAAYMAPEQFHQGATPKSDVYSLGVILYEMLTGKLPYEPDTMGRLARRKMQQPAPSVAAHVLNCPAWLDEIVSRMIDPDPKKRPHTTRAVALAFDELKRVDQTGRSAATEIAGSFNPINAGVDKSEANRLLGKPQQDAEAVPFFQSIWFLGGALAAVVALLVFAMWPAGSEKLYRKAAGLMTSETPRDWLAAREHLQTIIDRGSDDQYFDKAEVMYYETRRRTLVLQAEQGRVHGLQSDAARKFVEAVKLQQEEKNAEALEQFLTLSESVDPGGSQRHIHIESESRIEALEDLLRIERLIGQIEEFRSLETKREIEFAIERIEQVVSDHPDSQQLADTAREVLDSLKAKLPENAVPDSNTEDEE